MCPSAPPCPPAERGGRRASWERRCVLGHCRRISREWTALPIVAQPFDRLRALPSPTAVRGDETMDLRQELSRSLTVLLHALQKLDDDFTRGSDQHLTLSALFSVCDCLQTIREDRHAHHLRVRVRGGCDGGEGWAGATGAGDAGRGGREETRMSDTMAAQGGGVSFRRPGPWIRNSCLPPRPRPASTIQAVGPTVKPAAGTEAAGDRRQRVQGEVTWFDSPPATASS